MSLRGLPPHFTSEQARLFAATVGPRKTLQDRRRMWAREDREYKGWDGLSGGEQKRRNLFAKRVGEGVDPLVAIREALDLKHGPIPEWESQEEFDAYWNTAFLSEVASRWQRSPYFRSFSREQVREAHNSLGAAAMIFTRGLIELAVDPKTPKGVKAKVCAAGLDRVGVIAGAKLEINAADDRETLRKKGRAALALVKSPAKDGAAA